jgi:hypothetical protein
MIFSPSFLTPTAQAAAFPSSMYIKTILRPVVMEDKPGYAPTVSEQA